jgi:hypothetical protein
MATKTKDEQYSDEEARHRFEAALRGARKVGHEPMKDIPSKRKIAAHKMLKKPKAKKAAK